MITYQYQVLRFMPDRVNGEFINLGIIVFEPIEKQLSSKFIIKGSRASSLFPNINSRFLSKTLKTLQVEASNISKSLRTELVFSEIIQLDEITRKILPKDDSSLFFTETKKGFDLSIEKACNELFKRFILQNEDDDIKDSISDKEVWSKMYREYFDSMGISSHLHSHTIKTSNDELEFEKAWKNGKWNFFESVSFNLTRTDTIKNKVYKWVGKIDELKTSKEPVTLYILSAIPESNKEIKNFIFEKLGKYHDKKTEVELVTLQNLPKVALKIKKEIEAHNSKN
ncbi:DUF3037 domain-containing protein [Chitinophaga sp. NPDC101104]|uniref:DUF3037 domain-containing protein n=1 Tax=Chitinophaga sp. NPDC101104 TaxID=3390561 RepID=UPI003D024A81